eukprot:CAMPEP_0178983334 /NCGR_PEP_ID=MMETSP0795-20121207/1002_1 /TAXON_ID=88552 /ORGANISM="Amoebophrya sp., Strain Ameob2" /LENGTH=553 /DNA_ID=CAMNT_0020674095 /DNA_START=226 /DNA_END=1887 /DNA_ORIENTATION=-
MANPFGGGDNFSTSFDAFEQELMNPPAAADPGPQGMKLPPTLQQPVAHPSMGGAPRPPSGRMDGPSIIPSPQSLANQTVMSDMFEQPQQRQPDQQSSRGSWFGLGGGGGSTASTSAPPVLPAAGGPTGLPPTGTSMGFGGGGAPPSGHMAPGPAGAPPSAAHLGAPVVGGGISPTPQTLNPSFGTNAPTGTMAGAPMANVQGGSAGSTTTAAAAMASSQPGQISAEQQRQRGGAGVASGSAGVPPHGAVPTQQGSMQQGGSSGSFFSHSTSQEMKDVSQEALTAMGVNNPMANLAINAGMDQVSKNATFLTRYLPSFDYFKSYFAVNHMYVLKKLGILFFPFKKNGTLYAPVPEDKNLGLRPGHDKPDTDGQQIVVLKSNVEEPELYTPVMGFITYVVLIALHMGVTDRFHSDVFATTFKYSVLLGILENGVGKIAFLTINSSVSILDLIAFTGYKYVVLSVLTLFAMFLTYNALFWLFFVYFAAAACFAMWRFLSGYQSFNSDHAREMGIASNTGMLHKQVILVLAALQAFLIWFMLPSFAKGPRADLTVPR